MFMPQLEIASASARQPLRLLPRFSATSANVRPRMVIAHTDPVYQAGVCRHFHRLGWDVRRAGGGAEARWLAFAHEPTVAILQTDLPDQSGWLSCWKIRRDGQCDKVILVAPTPESAPENFARFVGATALVSQQAGTSALVDAVYDAELAGVG